jgi:hypothetical protein
MVFVCMNVLWKGVERGEKRAGNSTLIGLIYVRFPVQHTQQVLPPPHPFIRHDVLSSLLDILQLTCSYHLYVYSCFCACRLYSNDTLPFRVHSNKHAT